MIMTPSVSLTSSTVLVGAGFSLDLTVNPAGTALGRVECVLTLSSTNATLTASAAGDPPFTTVVGTITNGKLYLWTDNLTSLSVPTTSVISARIQGLVGSKAAKVLVSFDSVKLFTTNGVLFPKVVKQNGLVTIKP